MSDKAAEYRRHADECTARAGSAADHYQKLQYLELAAAWLKLARQTEDWWLYRITKEQ
jgi:hypothetical protein